LIDRYRSYFVVNCQLESIPKKGPQHHRLKTQIALGGFAGDVVPVGIHPSGASLNLGLFPFVCEPNESLEINVGCREPGVAWRKTPRGSLASAGVGFYRRHFEGGSVGLL